jgi:hypothetical protein
MTTFSLHQRKQRGVTQKLFLIEAIEKKSDASREYVIMGLTRNVYNVNICSTPTCTCPDYTTRGNRCKHIFFVLLRIMKVNDPDKAKYSDHDLKVMFSNLPEVTNTLCVEDKIKDRYARSKDNVIMAKDDDLCPICLEEIQNGEKFEYCRALCGKCIHTLCFSMWCEKNPAVCQFCKKPWGEQKYINLDN